MGSRSQDYKQLFEKIDQEEDGEVYLRFTHCKKSEDYMPQESRCMERAGLKMCMTYYRLHALLVSSNCFYMRCMQSIKNDVHFGSDPLNRSTFLRHIILER